MSVCHHLKLPLPIVVLCNEHKPETTTTTAGYQFIYIWLALLVLLHLITSQYIVVKDPFHSLLLKIVSVQMLYSPQSVM